MPSLRPAVLWPALLWTLLTPAALAAAALSAPASSEPTSSATAAAAVAPADSTAARIQALRSQGKRARTAGDMADAARLLDEALQLAVRTAGADSTTVAAVLVELGGLYTEMENPRRARQAYERIIRIAEAAGSAGAFHLLVALSGRGYCLQEQGDFQGARADFERALGILERQVDPDKERLSDVLNGYGLLLQSLGEYDRARTMLRRSLALAREAFGNTHPNVSGTLANLGALSCALGDYEQGLREFEEALRADEATLGADHPYVAGSANNLGAVLHYLGRDREALPLFERACRIAEKTLGPNDPTVGRYRVNTGTAQLALRDLTAARANIERGLPLLDADPTANSPEVAVALGDQAHLLVALGDLDGARTVLERSLAMRRALYGQDNPEVAAALHDLGNVLAARGDLVAARAHLEQALVLREAALGPAHPDVGSTLQDLASVCLEQHDWVAASRLAVRAERIGREHLRTLARGVSEREALAYAAVRPAGCDLALIAALGIAGPDTVNAGGERHEAADPALVRAAWDALLRSRCLVLDEMAFRRQAAASAAVRGTVAVADSLQQARSALASLVARPILEPAPAHLARVDAAARAKEELERRVARSIASVRRQVVADTSGFAAVARALPDHAALVAYAAMRTRRGQPEMCALVLPDANALASIVPLGDAERIEALVAAWRAAVLGGAVPPGPLLAASERACTAAGQQLRAAVWDPVAAVLQGAERVFVVADGVLQGVNISALPDGQGSYLLETGPLVHVLTSERDLLPESATTADDRRATGATGATGGTGATGATGATGMPGATGDVAEGASGSATSGLLAVGGPDFDAAQPGARGADDDALASVYRGDRSSCQTLQQLRFERLPMAAQEARDIARIFRGTGSQRVDVFEGTLASEARVKATAGAHAVLHIATHGFYLGRDCVARNSLHAGRPPWAVAHSGSAPASAVVGAEALESPLLLSGLAFAGANRRAEATVAQEDGILTAEEVAALDLGRTDWVVLSACNTGLGPSAAGEGVLGLRRSFRIAGARTLVLSLWPVEDTAARAWMADLYRARFERHVDTASAVESASLAALRRERAASGSAHPFRWAGFVAAGDWR